jgi:predicted lipoprotein with Yx(FWY)xxD motif
MATSRAAPASAPRSAGCCGRRCSPRKTPCPRATFTLVKRDDGRYQWALDGRPLYRWTSDKKWGDAGGDGVADVWHLVKVAPPKKDPAQ